MDNNSFFVTNDDLKSYIHDIHNFLRNNGVGYGMTSLNCFNLFYGLKLISSKIDLLGFSEEEKDILDYKNLVNNVKTTPGITGYIDTKILELLFEMKREQIFEPEKNNKNRVLADFLFHQIPLDVRDSVWKELILRIDKIPVGYDDTRKVNLSGKVYEYFIGRDKNAISELGAFFTDRHIVEFIYDKIQPTLDENGNVKTMIDCFAGSGGFTLSYAYYLRNKYKNIDWSKNNNKIYHFDMQKDVVSMAGIEMFAITGFIPENEYNFLRVNSFAHNFNVVSESGNFDKFNYVISNPPYGGDKCVKTGDNLKKQAIIDKLKEDISILEKAEKNTDTTKKLKIKKEQLLSLRKELENYKKNQELQMVNYRNCSKRIKDFCIKHNIESKYVNDKESASLILLVDLLAINGTAALVLKEGVFFDNKYSKLREVVTKNFNITNIISVPANAFENTTTKTSIIILHNNGPTTNITFSELVVEIEPENVFVEDEEGRVGIEKYKGEISRVYEKVLCNGTFEALSKCVEIKSKGKNAQVSNRYDWSWNYKNYNNYLHYVFKDGDTINMPNNHKLIKFGDIFKFKQKSKHQASEGKTEGKYRFYTSSNNIKYCDFVDINDNDNYYLIFGTGGNGSLFLDNCFSSSTDNFVCYSNDMLYTIYFYEYIKFYWDEFIKYHFNGSTMGHIKKENLLNVQIPVPHDIKTIGTQLLELKNLHDEITKNTELIPEKNQNIINFISTLTNKKNTNYMKIQDIFTILPASKYKTSEGKKEGKYHFYNSSEDNKLFCDFAEINKLSIIIGNGGTVNIHLDRNFTPTKHVSVLQSKNNNDLQTYYVYYYLLGNKKLLEDKSNTTVMGWLNKENINNTTIPVVSISELENSDFNNFIKDIETINSKLKLSINDYNNKIIKLFDVIKRINTNIENKHITNEKTIKNHLLTDIAQVIEIPKNIPDTKPKKNKTYKYPYYTANQIKYTSTPTYTGKHILCTRVQQNQGTFQLVDEQFSASNDLIIIKLKEEYEQQYEQVLEQLKNNFDYNKLINDDPVIITKNGKKEPVFNIGLKHLKNFTVEL